MTDEQTMNELHVAATQLQRASIKNLALRRTYFIHQVLGAVDISVHPICVLWVCDSSMLACIAIQEFVRYLKKYSMELCSTTEVQRDQIQFDNKSVVTFLDTFKLCSSLHHNKTFDIIVLNLSKDIYTTVGWNNIHVKSEQLVEREHGFILQ